MLLTRVMVPYIELGFFDFVYAPVSGFTLE